MLLIAVCEEPKAHLGHIAKAFGVSTEKIRLLRRLVEREGIGAVTTRKRGGSVGKGLTARDRKKVVTSLYPFTRFTRLKAGATQVDCRREGWRKRGADTGRRSGSASAGCA